MSKNCLQWREMYETNFGMDLKIHQEKLASIKKESIIFLGHHEMKHNRTITVSDQKLTYS